MPLSDLTGTKWVLNGTLSGDFSIATTTFNLAFSSNNSSYNSVYIDDELTSLSGVITVSYGNDYAYDYQIDDGTVEDNTKWHNQAYRIISITGGTDATNANLISWLEANATQVEVTDLSGTEWEIDNTVDGSSVANETFSLNFASNNTNYTSLFFDVWNKPIAKHIEYNSDSVYDNNAWVDPAYRTISITSGTDTTNPDLIAWLTNNATYQAPAVGNTYEITHSLTNLTHGNVSFTITPDTGYALPSSVSVTNGTLVSYDSSTGVVVVSGDSVEISVSCEAASVGYEVEIIGAGGHFERIYVQLNDDPTWYYAQMLMDGGGFGVLDTNIPNAYTILQDFSIGIANISKIKIGTDGNPANYTGPKYISGSSTGDFANLTFTSTGGSAPAYATGKITMTQDSTICFEGDD